MLFSEDISSRHSREGGNPPGLGHRWAVDALHEFPPSRE
jgi:hypothetical protein